MVGPKKDIFCKFRIESINIQVDLYTFAVYKPFFCNEN